MEGRLSLVLRNCRSELERMSEAVSTWCRDNAIPATAEFYVNLALDEIVSNVIRYGWKDDGGHYVHIRLSRLEDNLVVEVEDDAAPFNPLMVPEVDVNRPLEDRPVGGLGIHLVRNIMDGLEYRRVNGKNLFIMKRKTSGA